jgi:hypothetical protein
MDFINFQRTNRRFGFRELIGILNRAIQLPYPIYGVERLVYAASREAQPCSYMRRSRCLASRALRFFSSVLLSYHRQRLISCNTPACITSRRNLRKMDSSPSFSSTRICTLYPLAATTTVSGRPSAHAAGHRHGTSTASSTSSLGPRSSASRSHPHRVSRCPCSGGGDDRGGSGGDAHGRDRGIGWTVWVATIRRMVQINRRQNKGRQATPCSLNSSIDLQATKANKVNLVFYFFAWSEPKLLSFGIPQRCLYTKSSSRGTKPRLMIVSASLHIILLNVFLP